MAFELRFAHHIGLARREKTNPTVLSLFAIPFAVPSIQVLVAEHHLEVYRGSEMIRFCDY
jgi:hypothetical protein